MSVANPRLQDIRPCVAMLRNLSEHEIVSFIHLIRFASELATYSLLDCIVNYSEQNDDTQGRRLTLALSKDTDPPIVLNKISNTNLTDHLKDFARSSEAQRLFAERVVRIQSLIERWVANSPS
jgi:hypothetical protein